jgi:hypothetical protein
MSGQQLEADVVSVDDEPQQTSTAVVTFRNKEGKIIGVLDHVDDTMTFTGNADESATEFFQYLSQYVELLNKEASDEIIRLQDELAKHQPDPLNDRA